LSANCKRSSVLDGDISLIHNCCVSYEPTILSNTFVTTLYEPLVNPKSVNFCFKSIDKYSGAKLLLVVSFNPTLVVIL
jgi:hypothetical protein